MYRLPIPLIGAAGILGFLVILVLLVTVRPWAGPDESANTLLNYSELPPAGYSRTRLGLVGAGPETLPGWHPDSSATAADLEGSPALFVGYGCASCHGLDARGNEVGEDLSDVSPSDVRRALKKGPEGMPAFPSLNADEVDALVGLLTGPRPSETSDGREQAAPPLEAPAPSPTPSPPPEATPAPSPTPTPLPEATTAAGPTETSLPAPAVAEPTETPSPAEAGSAPASTPLPTGAVATSPAPTAEPDGGGPVSLEAAPAAISVDGDTSDWSEIPGTSVPMQMIRPIPGKEMRELPSVDVTLRVAVDPESVYVLLEVPDDYDYEPDDHGLSAAVAVMFRIDDPAAPHMGTTEEDQRKSLGKVDIWHWLLDCGPGVVSGGVTGIRGGNDPQCNLDDEYAETPKDLEDDGTAGAENSLAGVWEHTGRAQGSGAPGTWIFEMSRKLQTGDPDDAQLSPGTTAYMALAYWDADETPDGWTELGHLQSASGG